MKRQGFRWDIVFYCIAFISLLVDWFLYWFGAFDLLGFFSLIGICIGFVSLGVALESRQTSRSSDRKMQDIAIYLVNEKLAILSSHISQGNACYLNDDFHTRVLHDLDAALSVVDWVTEKLPDLSNAVDSLKSKTEQTIRTHKNKPTVGNAKDFYNSLDGEARLIGKKRNRSS